MNNENVRPFEAVRREREVVEPPNSAAPAHDGLAPLPRRRLDWQSTVAVVSIILVAVGIVATIIFGVSQVLSTHVSDVNANVNEGLKRVQEDVRDVRDEVRAIDAKVDDLGRDLGYVKGRLDGAQENGNSNENPSGTGTGG